MSADLSFALHAQVLTEYIDTEGTDTLCRELAARFALIPLWRDWMGFIGLAADGELMFVPWEAPHSAAIVEEPHWRRIALAQGSEAYPRLASLRPVRPAGAVTCPTCRGTGQSRLASGEILENIVCQCGGLAWIPASEAANRGS